jgi:ABC-type glycerol-3-phosphate transport system substrate-binding protein
MQPSKLMSKQSVIIVIIILCSCIDMHKSNISDESIKNLNLIKVTSHLNFVGHWLYQAKREVLLREVVNEYEFLNQNCSVNLVFPEEIYYTRAKADCEEEFVSKQLLSDTPKYDILRINDQYLKIAFYMKDPDWPKKYLVDFSQYPDLINNSLPELVNDSAKAKWRGIIPGPSLEGYNYTIWYNQEFAKKIGLTIKQFDMTFDDLLGYIKTIDAYNKSHNTNIIPIQENGDWSTVNIIALRLYLSELGDLNECLQDSYTERKLNAYYKTLKAFEELSKYNAYPKEWRSYEFMNTLDYPLKQKCFFYVNASWMYNYWQKVDNGQLINMVPAELPVFKPNDVYFGGYSVMWAVPKNAPNKEEAVKFLLYITRPDISEKWMRYTKCPSGIKGPFTSVSFGKDNFEEFTFTINKKYGSRKLSFNYLDNNMVLGVSRRGIDLHTIDVAIGNMTADEALADIRKQLRNFR